jgi:glutathione peroxidase
VATLLALVLSQGAWAEGSQGAGPGSVLEFDAQRLSGQEESLSQYRGDVLLIVNTASQCGYTPQYDGLQTLYQKYRDQGFSILGFPSNDFGAQEPGTDSQIGAFCKRNYGVEFPMFSKVRVKGPEQHALYGYLTSLPEPVGGPVKWNFQKYLVDRSGHVVSSYASAVKPLDKGLVASIENLLATPTSPPEAGSEVQ